MDYVVIKQGFWAGRRVDGSARCREQELLDSQKENTVYDVLVKGYGEDLGLVLKKYIEIEKDRIQQAGILRGSQRLRLLSYVYRLTDSRIQQPVNETVVDFIFRVTLEGDGGRLQLRISGSGISSICARARGLVLGRLFSPAGKRKQC